MALHRLLEAAAATLEDVILESPGAKPTVELVAQYFDWAVSNIVAWEWYVEHGRRDAVTRLQKARQLLDALKKVYEYEDFAGTYQYERLVLLLELVDDILVHLLQEQSESLALDEVVEELVED